MLLSLVLFSFFFVFFYILFFYLYVVSCFFFFFSSRRRHTRSLCDWSSDVCSSDLLRRGLAAFTRVVCRGPGRNPAARAESVLPRQSGSPWAGGRAARRNVERRFVERSEERRVGKECRCGWSPWY